MTWFKKRDQTEGTCASMLAPQSGSNPLHANLNRERFPWQLTRLEPAGDVKQLHPT
jgi:hypothetical protein